MGRISIAPLERGDLSNAAQLAARAFATTPFHLAISKDSEYGMSRVFHSIFQNSGSQIFGAKEGGQLVGVMRIVEWPKRRMSPLQTTRLILATFYLGFGAGLRAMKGRRTWALYDPEEPHWHLDPLTVVPEKQRQGIGTMLLKEFCARADKTGTASYLETDRPENVRLYERFGFKVTKEIEVIGVHCWFMWRSAIT